MDTILKTINLTKTFGGLIALNKVNFEIKRGMIVGIIGPNGAGKTTFFNCLTGVYTPDRGEILFNGTKINRLKSHQIARLGILRTFQNIRLFNNMTVIENILAGHHCRMRAGLWGVLTRNKRTLREEKNYNVKARDLLSFVGLKGKGDRIAKTLPYGDQRRLEIARALAAEPCLLLLDEPTAGMNPRETSDLTQFVKRIREELGLSILLIEHDMRVIMEISDKVTVLDYGTRISEGTPLQVQKDPQVIGAYLGCQEIMINKKQK